MKTKNSVFKLVIGICSLLILTSNKANATIHYYSNLDELLDFVGYICKTSTDHNIIYRTSTKALPGDIIVPDPLAGNIQIDLDDLALYATGCVGGTPSLPLVIPEGVLLCGHHRKEPSFSRTH